MLLLGALATGRVSGQASLSYSATNIVERWQNDGIFNPAQNLLTVTLTGASFTNLPAGADLIAGGQVTTVNVPYGLTPVALAKSSSQVTVSLSGNAGTNGPAASTNGVRFIFGNNAFSNYPAASVTWAGGSNLTVSFLAAASNWYVNGASGSDSNNGLTPATAFKTIAKAHTSAQGGLNDVIHIAAGCYNQPAMITVSKNVTFQGDDPATTILQPLPGVATLFYYNSSPNTMYQNLTLQGCTNTAISQPNNNAGNDLIVSNCWFFNNATPGSGGAIFNMNNGGGSMAWGLRCTSCLFANNAANSAGINTGGGAVASYGGLWMWFNNCTFIGNTAATNGGAVYTYNGAAWFINSAFYTNAALRGSGGAFASGAYNDMYADRCLFASNSAGLGTGGAISCNAFHITNSTFYANTATNGAGGAVYGGRNSGNHHLYNSTVAWNLSSNSSAVRAPNAVPVIVSSILASNVTSGAYTQPDYSGYAAAVSNSLIGVFAGGSGQTAFGLPNASGNYVGVVLTNAQAGVLPLANNGGLFASCALLSSGVAVNSGTNPVGLFTDVRGPGYARVSGAQADIGAYESGNAILPNFVYSSTLFNGDATGHIVTTNTITLVSQEDDTLSGSNGQDFVAAGWLTVANVPSGLTAVATRTSATNLSVTLTGAATSPTNVFNIAFAFNSSAVVAPAGVSNNFTYAGNQSVNNIAAIFTAGTGAPALLYSGGGFAESVANDGSVTNTITITLTNALFVDRSANDYVALGRLSVANVPAGLTAHAALMAPYQVPQVLTVWFTGIALQHNTPNNASLVLTFQDSAFAAGTAAAVANYTTNMPLQFLNPVLAYVGKGFYESWQNDGSISNTILATIVGDTFRITNGEEMVTSGKVTPSGVPIGLTAVVTYQSVTSLVVSLTGLASPNTAGQNTSSMGLTFATTAFTLSQSASLVTNYNESDFSVTFLSTDPTNWYVDASVANDLNSGTTWGTAFQSLTNALAHARVNGNDVINIAAGTNAVPAGGIVVNRVVTFVGADPATTIVQPSAVPNVVTNTPIFSISADGMNATFRNLTLRNGRAPQGGAINTVNYRANVVASNCYFAANAATNAGGGAIYSGLAVLGFTLQLTACTFSNNTASGQGGAVYDYSWTGIMSNCVFVGNRSATNGGAFFHAAQNAGDAIVNSLFLNNQAGGYGGAYGATLNGGSTLSLNGCGFVGNTAAVGGGGVSLAGPLTGMNSTLCSNSCATYGGGIYNSYNSGASYFYNSTFFQNSAATGGAFRAIVQPVFTSCIVASNLATSGFAPDLNASGVSVLASNAVIGITNGAFGAASPTLAAAGPDTPNAYSNYCGTAAAPQNPGLLFVAANGGLKLGCSASMWPTYTCALQANSVAVNHGVNPLGLVWDQRGTNFRRAYAPRLQPQIPDIGAFEYGAGAPVPGTLLEFR
jgi:predicted outer membrane repeat protein